MKRILSIQDISCFGRCSQTVALPIISALGIETVILPTALLSTHTGDFSNYSFLPLNNEIKNITEHWKSINLTFDAIYVGYIGTSELVDNIVCIIDEFSDKNTLIYIDPAMADNASLYSGIDMEYVSRIKELCKKADIICPNIYEAMLLSDFNCTHDYTTQDIEYITKKAGELAKKTIITGIHKGEEILTLGYERNSKASKKIINKKYDGMFYGTGDIFASTFIGAYLNGIDFFDSIAFSDGFVQKCIENTISEHKKYWYGINFESCLSCLTEFYNNKKINPHG